MSDCQTAAYGGLAGMKNGALLDAAEACAFEVMISTDQEIPNTGLDSTGKGRADLLIGAGTFDRAARLEGSASRQGKFPDGA